MKTKEKRKSGLRPRVSGVLTALLLILIIGIVGKIIFEWIYPFELTPSFAINFQTEEGIQALSQLHKEDNCFPAYNGERQCYMMENVSIDTRGLVLRAEYVGNDEDGNPFITSGRVDTRDFFHPSCGKYEFVASFPSGTGVFAAIWLREPDWIQPDPSLVNPAINIVEYQGGMENTAHFNLHTNLTLSMENYQENSESVDIGNFANTLHTFGIEWTRESVRYLIDGKTYHTVENRGDWVYGPTDIIINLAMGGNWSEAIATREGLQTWHGIELQSVGQTWEVVVQNVRYYPLRNPSDCQ